MKTAWRPVMPLYQDTSNQSSKNEKEGKFEKVFSLQIPAHGLENRNYTAVTKSLDMVSNDESTGRKFSSVMSKSPIKHLKSGNFIVDYFIDLM